MGTGVPSQQESGITKPINSEYMASRANYFVKNKYQLQTIELIPNKPIYILNAKSTTFDKILRRTPREVYKYSDDYVVPLGYTATQAITNAYGLSNGMIYNDKRWFSLIGAFNKSLTEENANKLFVFLRAAAVVKYITVSGITIIPDLNIDFIEQVLSIHDKHIISYFSDMVS